MLRPPFIFKLFSLERATGENRTRTIGSTDLYSPIKLLQPYFKIKLSLEIKLQNDFFIRLLKFIYLKLLKLDVGILTMGTIPSLVTDSHNK
jgi:hypothetical protein